MTTQVTLTSKAYNPSLGQFITTYTEVTATFRSAVATKSLLPLISNLLYDARITLDDNHLYCWNGTSWIDVGVNDVYDYVVNESIPGPLPSEADNIIGLNDILKNLILNSMLNAFRIATQGSLALLKMIDQFIDEYEDESGINLSDSINEFYNSTDDYYSPSFLGDVKLWLDFENSPFIDLSPSSHAVTTNLVVQQADPHPYGTYSGSFGIIAGPNYNWLEMPDHADWDIAANNTDNKTWELFVKISGYHIFYWREAQIFYQRQDDNNYMKLRNSTSAVPDYRLLFEIVIGGVQKIALDAPYINELVGSEQWHHIAIIKVGNQYGLYLDGQQVAYDTNNDVLTLAGTFVFGNKFDGFVGNMDNIRFSNSNIYNVSPNVGLTDSLIVPTEIFPVNNMMLISEPQTADSVPTEARLIIFEEDVDAITLNTDLKGYVSRDNGVTFTQVTLENEGSYVSGARVLSGLANVAGQPSGTNMVYKLTSHNNKNLKIHGTAISWR